MEVMKHPDAMLANQYDEMIPVHCAKYNYGVYGNVLHRARYYLHVPDEGPVVFYELQNDDGLIPVVQEFDSKGQLCVRLRKQVRSRGSSSPDFTYRSKLIPAARVVFDTFDNGCTKRRQQGKIVLRDGDATNLRPDNLCSQCTHRASSTKEEATRPVVLYDMTCQGEKHSCDSLKDAVAKFNFQPRTANRAVEGKIPAVKSINSGHQFVIRYAGGEDENPNAVLNEYLKEVKARKEAKRQLMTSIRQAKYINNRLNHLQDEVD